MTVIEDDGKIWQDMARYVKMMNKIVIRIMMVMNKRCR